MSLIYIALTIILIGVALWLVETYVPMSPPIQAVLRIVVVIFLFLWLLQMFGVVGPTIRTR